MRLVSGALFLGLTMVVPATPAGAEAAVPQRVQAVVPGLDLQAPKASAKIGPLDRLEVIVFREPELSSADVPVDESGRINLPLVGGVSAAGKSTEDLADDIAVALKRYVRNPLVSVYVKQAAAKRVAVTGSVMEPGVFPIEGRMTLLQAVALARGPSQVAALDQALIFRVQNGQRTAAKFNLEQIARGRVEDPEVLPGDTVALGSSKTKTAWRDIMLSLRSFNIFSLIP